MLSKILSPLIAGSFLGCVTTQGDTTLELDSTWYDDIENENVWSLSKTTNDFYHGLWPAMEEEVGTFLYESFYVPSHANDLYLEINFTYVVGCDFDLTKSFLWFEFEYNYERLVFDKIKSFAIDSDLGLHRYAFNAHNPYANDFCLKNVSIDLLSELQETKYKEWANVTLTQSFLVENDNRFTFELESDENYNVLSLKFGCAAQDETDAFWGIHSISIQTDTTYLENHNDDETGTTDAPNANVIDGNDQGNEQLDDTTTVRHAGNSDDFHDVVNWTSSQPWWVIMLIVIAFLGVMALCIGNCCLLARNCRECCRKGKEFRERRRSTESNNSSNANNLNSFYGGTSSTTATPQLIQTPSNNLFNAMPFNDDVMRAANRQDILNQHYDPEYESESMIKKQPDFSKTGKKRNLSLQQTLEKSKNKLISKFPVFHAKRRQKKQEESITAEYTSNFAFPPFQFDNEPPSKQNDPQLGFIDNFSELDKSLDSLVSRSKQSSNKWGIRPNTPINSISSIAAKIKSPFDIYMAHHNIQRDPVGSQSGSLSASAVLGNNVNANISNMNSTRSLNSVTNTNTNTMGTGNFGSMGVMGLMNAMMGYSGDSQREQSRTRTKTAGSVIDDNFDIPDRESELSETDYQDLFLQDMAQEKLKHHSKPSNGISFKKPGMIGAGAYKPVGNDYSVSYVAGTTIEEDSVGAAGTRASTEEPADGSAGATQQGGTETTQHQHVQWGTPLDSTQTPQVQGQNEQQGQGHSYEQGLQLLQPHSSGNENNDSELTVHDDDAVVSSDDEEESSSLDVTDITNMSARARDALLAQKNNFSFKLPPTPEDDNTYVNYNTNDNSTYNNNGYEYENMNDTHGDDGSSNSGDINVDGNGTRGERSGSKIGAFVGSTFRSMASHLAAKGHNKTNSLSAMSDL